MVANGAWRRAEKMENLPDYEEVKSRIGPKKIIRSLMGTSRMIRCGIKITRRSKRRFRGMRIIRD